MRAQWNEGQHETWAYTEDETVLFGSVCAATGGGAQETDGESSQSLIICPTRHQKSIGGLSFGDGNLSYGREEIDNEDLQPLSRSDRPPCILVRSSCNISHNPGYKTERGLDIVRACAFASKCNWESAGISILRHLGRGRWLLHQLLFYPDAVYSRFSSERASEFRFRQN